jgi:AraC-like DNA-binding protein
MSKRLGDGMEYQNENFNGEYDFRSRFHEGWYIPENLHEYSELIYCVSGSGIVTVNGKRIPLKEKELIWIPPNYIHRYDFDSSDVICAVFSNDFIPLFFRTLGDRYFCVSAVNMEQMSEVLEKFPELNKNDTLRISGYLNLICARVLERSEFEQTRHTDGILYQNVISYLSKHYTENLALSQVAKAFGYNTKYLSHTLHELTGINFRRLLNFYRINHAKKLLENAKSMNVSAVAAESGFGALNTFNREFKKLVGMTPSVYRKRLTR